MPIDIEVSRDLNEVLNQAPPGVRNQFLRLFTRLSRTPDVPCDQNVRGMRGRNLGAGWRVGWKPYLKNATTTRFEDRYEKIKLTLIHDTSDQTSSRILPLLAQDEDLQAHLSDLETGDLNAHPINFLKSIPAWAILMDLPAEHVVWCNDAAAILFGRTPSEMKGRNRSQLFYEKPHTERRGPAMEAYRIRFSNDQEANVCGCFERFAFAAAGSKQPNYTGDLTFDWSWLEQLERIAPIWEEPAQFSLPKQGSPTDPNDFNQDVLAAFVENLRTVALIKKPCGRIVWCNKEFERLVLRLNQENGPFIGETSAEVFNLPPDEEATINMYEEKVLTEGRPVFGKERIRGDMRLTLRFPIWNAPHSEVAFVGVASTERAYPG